MDNTVCEKDANEIIVSFEKKHLPITQISPNIPKIQREINISAVKSIMDDEESFYKKHKKYCIPGCLSIVVWKGNEYIIDGQHRLKAYTKLNKDYPERTFYVHIDYYTVENEQDIEFLYKKVNTCTPNPILGLTLAHYKIIDEVREYFKTTFAPYISKNKNCHAPSFCLEAVLEIIENKLLKCVNWNGEQIIDNITQLNRWYSKQKEDTLIKWGLVQKHIAVVRKHSPTLYLSMYRNYEWIDRLLDVFHGHALNELTHVTIVQNDRVTVKLRNLVWNKYGYKKDAVQPCHCCQKEIEKGVNFVCGHVIPRARGGKSVLDNLEPICNECNIDMKTMDMKEYIKNVKEQLEL
jgi:hypothetical protein